MKMKNENNYKPYGSSPDDIAYRVGYNPKHEPFILINGHEISKPHFTKDNGDLFGYIYNNPNRTITIQEISEKIKIVPNKGIDDILRDLGFKGDLAKLFFKKMTNNQVHFINPVYQKDLERLDINYTDIWKLTHTPKRKGALSMTR